MPRKVTGNAAHNTKADSPSYKRVAYDVIRRNRAAALATVDAHGIPHVATVYCLAKRGFTVYFVTRVEARKYHNILFQPIVAMTFTNEGKLESVQLTGRAERVESLQDEQAILYELMSLRHEGQDWPLPPIKQYERGAASELAVIKVIPTELTYANFTPAAAGKYQPFFHQVI